MTLLVRPKLPVLIVRALVLLATAPAAYGGEDWVQRTRAEDAG